ncbi:MAG: hypothetical protein C0601_08810 [Candidatus Muiribacterium halophilum]|uniref:6-bladed beta-propeller n=1 Tax=Muiribacterium halophilum TaxID=2053465 RepID=A0A2N5ZE30_MUIH1|nr:MAG: hypothetical protein C0601_08810 [Candidatus Muirbacterium halophilum]
MFFKRISLIVLILFVVFNISCMDEETTPEKKTDLARRPRLTNKVPVLEKTPSDSYRGYDILKEINIEKMPLDKEILNIPIDDQGNIYIIVPHTGIVKKYSPDGVLLKTIDTGLKDIKAIHKNNGSFYVLDTYRQTIFKAGEDLDIGEKILEGRPKVERKGDYTISIDPEGIIYIFDLNKGVVEIFRPGFKKIREIDIGLRENVRFAFDIKDARLFCYSVSGAVIRGFSLKSGKRLFNIEKSGTGAGELGAQINVAYLDDKLYVADTNNNRIQLFDAEDGRFLSQLGKQGSAPGEFIEPYQIYADRSSLIFVLERGGHRIQVFDKSLKYLRTISKYGKKDSMLNSPEMIFGISELGFIFVLDSERKRIQAFSFQGDFLRSYMVLSSYIDNSFGVIADSNGGVFILSPEGQRVIKYDTDSMIRNIPGSDETLSNIAVDDSGNILFVNRTKKKLQYNEKTGRSLFVNYSIMTEGSPDVDIKIDYFCVDSEGSIYTMDRYNHMVSKYSSSGELLFQIGKLTDSDGDFRMDYGFGKGEFKNPFYMDVDANDNLYVNEIGNNRIQKFSKEGRYLNSFGKTGLGKGTFIGKFTFVISKDGFISIADYARSIMQIFDITGAYISEFGKFGHGKNRFVNPMAIGMDKQQDIYVLNSKNLEPFATNGTLVLKKMKMIDLFGKGISWYEQGRFDKAIDYFYEISRHRKDDKTLFYGWYSSNKLNDLEKKKYFGKLLKNNNTLDEKIISLLEREGFTRDEY